jgi:hypothetical protein
MFALLLVAACGGDELFEPQLASNQRLLSSSATASLGKDDETFDEVTVVGDLDGDGVDDAVIRTIYTTEDSSEIDGRVYVAYGGAGLTGDLELASLPTLVGGRGFVDSLAVAGVGDVDGDGRADFLVSAARSLRCAGNIDDASYPTGAYLVYGGARLTGSHELAEVSTFLRDAHPCSAISSVTGLGDVDGDGTPDFAIARFGTHPDEPNAALIFYGGGARLPATVDLVATADASFSWSGQAFEPGVAALGDVDGDGRADFALREAIPLADTVHLIRGGARLAGAVTVATASQTAFTQAGGCRTRPLAARLGDLDGDGADDFAFVGCQTSSELFAWHPVDRIFYGRRTGFPAQVALADADARITLDPRSPGRSAIAAGDLDGDGLRDLVVGDPGMGDGVGGAHLVLGNGSRLAGEVDTATRGLTYVGRPRHGTNCDFIGTPDCVYQEQVGYGLSVGELTGDDKLDVLASAGAESGVIPLGAHGAATDRAYVLTPFP